MIKPYYEQLALSSDFISYCGLVNELPEYSRVGDIYKVGQDFYIFYNINACTKLLTESDVSSFFQNYYNKDEIDSKTSGISQRLNELSANINIDYSNFESMSSGFLKKEDLAAILSEKEVEINSYKSACASFKETLCSNWNEEMDKISLYKSSLVESLNYYKFKYKELYQSYDNRITNLVIDVNTFKNSVENDLKELFGNDYNSKIDELKNMANNAEQIEHSLENLDSSISGIMNVINELSSNFNDKFNMLLSSEQGMIEE